MSNKAPLKILIIQTAFIGDVILTTSLIHNLKLLFPDAFLDFIVNPQCATLLENNPYLRNIITINKTNNLFDLITTMKNIRSENYFLSISPHSSFRSGFMVWGANIKYRLGFKRSFQQILLTHSIKHPQKIHKRLKNLELLKIIPRFYQSNSSTLFTQTELFPAQINYEKANQLLVSLMNLKQKGIILLAPGSIWFTKRWPLQNYLVLTQKLLEQNYFVILSGSPQEKKLCEYIMENIYNLREGMNEDKSQHLHYICRKGTPLLLSIAGNFNLLDSAALIEKVDLVICNDSGTLHIANAMQTPVFAFFGPTVQDLGYFPYQERDFVFEANLSCRPCGSHGGHECPQKHFECMKRIEVDSVMQKINAFFEQYGSKNNCFTKK